MFINSVRLCCLTQANLSPIKPGRFILRVNVEPFSERGLDNPNLTDDDIIQAMLAEPILINRPIVVAENGKKQGVKLCRPSEVVLDLIDMPLTQTFVKEDGEKIEPKS